VIEVRPHITLFGRTKPFREVVDGQVQEFVTVDGVTVTVDGVPVYVLVAVED
jgi:hypothetical protein